MAITESGLYATNLVRAWENTLGFSLETDGATKGMLALDTYTPQFWTQDARNDVTNEVSGTVTFYGTTTP